MQETARTGYEADFAQWAESQAAALRDGRFADVDIENVSEEIESLSRSDRRELRSRLTTLMLHLLKFQYQPERATPSWRLTILEQVAKIDELLEESPSLKPAFAEFYPAAYGRARREASVETELPLATFPATPTAEFLAALGAALDGDASGSQS